MSIAIIAEYNPFHNGHIYQLNYVKKHFPNEKIVVILSGKYTQRGELAVADFETRKQFALKFGADEVIKLPFKYATQAAHIFAQGAIEIVAENKIDKLIFGSESNNIDQMYFLATTIKDNFEKYNQLIKMFLKQGNSFPNASALALKELTGSLITLPNDILGFEYVKAIVFNNYSIKAHCLKRTINFHSETPEDHFASASYLRKLIYKNENISQYSPMKFISTPDRIENHYPQFQKIVREKSSEELAQFHLVSEGIQNLFKKHINAPDFDSFINRVNSKRYTSSRIKRIMLYILLQITNPDEIEV
ncbi:hypothetical protein DR103_03080 [Mycoplasma hyorhinis]|uniref:nucleotidyltransferase n=1 Tax=Mesomycoplasma hyorhinis TaxID=2100 RepID=UPI00136CF68D|nr:nucleotidyltransferase [Mesomycoplasma hyorhinis]MXR08206.1 hypothetical protein [Mesomycoplasma hyorhinis]